MKLVLFSIVFILQLIRVYTIPQLHTWKIPQTEYYTQIDDSTLPIDIVDDSSYLYHVDRILPKPNRPPAHPMLLTGYLIVLLVTGVIAMTGFLVSTIRGGSDVGINVGKTIPWQPVKTNKGLQFLINDHGVIDNLSRSVNDAIEGLSNLYQ